MRIKGLLHRRGKLLFIVHPFAMRTFGNPVRGYPEKFDPEQVEPVAGLRYGQRAHLVAVGTGGSVKLLNFRFAGARAEEENHCVLV